MWHTKESELKSNSWKSIVGNLCKILVAALESQGWEDHNEF